MADELKGAKELSILLKSLGRLPEGRILKKTAELAGVHAVDEAARRIPVQDVANHLKKTYKGRLVLHPGFAQRNVAQKSFVTRDRKKAGTLIGVRAEAFYAINFVELETGSSKRARREWLRPSFAATKDRMLSTIVTNMRTLITKEVRRRLRKIERARG